MALIDGLVSWWDLDEASGIRLDAHGPYDLTDVNTVASAAGKHGQCAVFDAANDESLTVSHDGLTLGGTTEWAYALWFKVPTLEGGNRDIIGHNGNSLAVAFRESGGGGFRIRTWDSTSSRTDTGLSFSDLTNGFVPNAWYCLFVWFDGDTIYGQLCDETEQGPVNSSSIPGGIFEINNVLTIGDGGAGAFTGSIDSVLRLNRAFTEDDRDAFWNDGAGISYADISGGSAAEEITLGHATSSSVGYGLAVEETATADVVALSFAASTGIGYGLATVPIPAQRSLGYAASTSTGYGLTTVPSPAARTLSYVASTTAGHAITVIGAVVTTLAHAASTTVGYSLAVEPTPTQRTLSYATSSTAAYSLDVRETGAAALGYAPTQTVGYGITAVAGAEGITLGRAESSTVTYPLQITASPAERSLAYSASTSQGYSVQVTAGIPDAEAVALGFTLSETTGYPVSVIATPATRSLGYAAHLSAGYSLRIGRGLRLRHAPTQTAGYPLEVVAGALARELAYAASLTTGYPIHIQDGTWIRPESITTGLSSDHTFSTGLQAPHLLNTSLQ